MKPDKQERHPTFFSGPEEFAEWLKDNHDGADELWVGFYKSGSSGRGITYSEALDTALCYGWIDAVRKNIDGERWMIRFTPRKPGGNWSLINVGRVKEMIRLGSMKPPGMKAFESRREDRTGIYAYEQEGAKFSEEFERKFKRNRKAWEFFGKQAAWYRRNSTHWVMRAKKEETRLKRLDELIGDSAKGKRLARYGG